MDIQRMLNDTPPPIDMEAKRLTKVMATYSRLGREAAVHLTGDREHRIVTVAVTTIEPLTRLDEEELIALIFLHGFQVTAGARWETHRGRYCAEWTLTEGVGPAGAGGPTAPR